MKKLLLLCLILLCSYTNSTFGNTQEDAIGISYQDTLTEYQVAFKSNTQYLFISGEDTLETEQAHYTLSPLGVLEITRKTYGYNLLQILQTDTLTLQEDTLHLNVFFISSGFGWPEVKFKNSENGIIDSICGFKFLIKEPSALNQIELRDSCLYFNATSRDTFTLVYYVTPFYFNETTFFLFPDINQPLTDTATILLKGITNETVQIESCLAFSNLLEFGHLDEFQISYCDGSGTITNNGNFSSITLLGDSCMHIEATNYDENAVDTFCIFACYHLSNFCDTTLLFIKFDKKYESDTIVLGKRDSICIPTDQGMDADLITLLNCKGAINNISDITFNKNDNGCNYLSYQAVSLGIDSFCAVICDTSLGICDTTIVSINVVYPKKDTIRFNYLRYAFDPLTEDWCFPIEPFFELEHTDISFCNSESSYEGSVFSMNIINDSCLRMNGKFLSFGTDTACVKICDTNLGICDTTILILSRSLIFQLDTVEIYATPELRTFCLPLEAPLTEENAVSIFCDGGTAYTGSIAVAQFISNNCLGFSLWNAAPTEQNDTICIRTFNTLTNAYDITVIIIKNGVGNKVNLKLNALVDRNKNCLEDSSFVLNAPVLLKFQHVSSNRTFYHSFSGSTSLALDTGQYVITPVGYEDFINYHCNPLHVTIDSVLLTLNDTLFEQIYFFPNSDTGRLFVEIYTNRTRYCNVPINYTVKYSNHSSKPISNAFIDIVLDDQLRFSQSIFPNYTLTDSTHVRFQIGTLSPYQSDQLTFNANLPCGVSTPGETHCTEAHIYPDTLTQRLYFGPEIVVEGSCEGDSVAFRVTNNGNPMTQPAIYLVFEDDLMIKRTTYQLASGASFTERFIANGHTYRMEAHLYANPPQVYGDSISAAWVEGCDNTGGTVSKGYILMYDLDEEVDYIAKDCHQSVTSWDPNEKIGTPEGYHEQHYIRKNQAIEYGINFENLGNDTAYIVVIVDTLSQALDTNTFSMLLSSHPCFYTLKNYVLTVTFPNINLLWTNNYPDSSKGFFLYQIQPKDDIALSSKIENTAYIYFDNNSPVQTNTTLHTIGEKFVRVLSVYNQQGKRLEARVYPNPANKWVNIEIMDLPINDKVSISIFSIDGKKLSVINTVPEGKFTVDISNLADGMYFFTMQNDSEQLLSGKFVIER